MKSLTGVRSWGFTSAQPELPKAQHFTGNHCAKLAAWKASLEAGKKEMLNETTDFSSPLLILNSNLAVRAFQPDKRMNSSDPLLLLGGQ